MTLPSLDGLAKQYAELLRSVPRTQHENIALHIPGKHSVYEQRFTLYTMNAPRPFDFHYIGNTARPLERPSEHVSEFMRASVKTHHGKSKMFDPRYMTGLIAMRFEFTVIESGFDTKELAELRAREIAAHWAELYTAEYMLSNQNRGRGPDVKPRHRRTFKAPAELQLT